jgi:dihydrodipicolinate reductase
MNSKKKIGIIGYGGRMGKYLIDAIEDRYFLRQ